MRAVSTVLTTVVVSLTAIPNSFAQTAGLEWIERRKNDFRKKHTLAFRIDGPDRVDSIGIAVNGKAWKRIGSADLTPTTEIPANLVDCYLCRSGPNRFEINVFAKDGTRTDYVYNFESTQRLVQSEPVRIVAEQDVSISDEDVSRFSEWATSHNAKGAGRIITLHFNPWEGGLWGLASDGVVAINSRILAYPNTAQQVVFAHESGHLACHQRSDSALRTAYAAIDSHPSRKQILDVIGCESYLPPGSKALGYLRSGHQESCAEAQCVRTLFPDELAARRATLGEAEAALLDHFLATASR